MEEFKKPGLNIIPKRVKSLEKKETESPSIQETESIAEVVFSEIVGEVDSSNDIITEVTPKVKESNEATNFDQTKEDKQEKYNALISQLKYTVPPGAEIADSRYSLDILKNGLIIDHVKFLFKSHFVIGRIPACDIIGENPTISRMHAVIQFIGDKNQDPKSKTSSSSNQFDCKEKGLYIYDLNSTHGTFLNKNRLYPNKFYRLKVGHTLKFGNSSRLYLVAGPSEDEEEEDSRSVTEILQEKLERELERKKLLSELSAQGTSKPEETEDNGISWGMAEDAEEEEDSKVNPFSIDFDNSELNLDNPKKSLRSWFEREGHDLVYDVREKAAGHFICRINLPVDGPNNTSVFAEVELKGKKKDVVHQCAMKACQILDKYGVLRQSHQEGKTKKKLRNWEEQDYYSSDEDIFLDRTGSIERKRVTRMKIAGKFEEKVENFDSLSSKYSEMEKEIKTLKQKIDKAEKKDNGEGEVDPLDAFMQDLKAGVSEMKKMKQKLKVLTEEQNKVKKLMDIARPANLPEINLSIPKETKSSDFEMKKDKNDTSIPQNEQSIKSIFEDSKEIKKLSPPEFVSKPKPIPSENLKRKTPIKIPIKDKTKVDPEVDTEEIAPTIKVNKRIKKNPDKNVKYEYDASDPDYSVWVPPNDQSGDGRTKLNERLGY